MNTLSIKERGYDCAIVDLSVDNGAVIGSMYRDYAGDVVKATNSHDALVSALEFYADPKNWESVNTGIGDLPGDAIDYGSRARAALETEKE